MSRSGKVSRQREAGNGGMGTKPAWKAVARRRRGMALIEDSFMSEHWAVLQAASVMEAPAAQSLLLHHLEESCDKLIQRAVDARVIMRLQLRTSSSCYRIRSSPFPGVLE